MAYKIYTVTFTECPNTRFSEKRYGTLIIKKFEQVAFAIIYRDFHKQLLWKLHW